MSKKNDALSSRMKRYEAVPKLFLTRRVPVIIRLDGKAFHTFTRKFKKPFDPVMMKSMQDTMLRLCENIQGCVFGYTQSDEISLLLTDYATISTDAWFGYNLEKIVSISSSMATAYFNEAFKENILSLKLGLIDYPAPGDCLHFTQEQVAEMTEVYEKAIARLPIFDSRTFSIPKEEVCNCFIWRQQDATRNSIEAVGQANFSDKQLHKKSTNEIQDMLFKERGINWNDYPVDCKRGSCCYKVEVFIPCENGTQMKYPEAIMGVYRRKWAIDKTPPIFTQDRAYIEQHL